MTEKHLLLRGTLVLSAAGFLTRIMGFFFRIFLSHSFGEEGMGLYQLIFPVYILCLSVSTSGLQTALSRITATKMTDLKEAHNALRIALGLSLVLSFIQIIVIQQNADRIARSFLGDARCAELLLIVSYALPFAAIHSCFCGFFLGLQKTGFTAVSQLIEQTVRIFFVITLFFLLLESGRSPSIHLAAAGIVSGELAASIFTANRIKKLSIRKNLNANFSAVDHFRKIRSSIFSSFHTLKNLLFLSVPLTAGRVSITLLQSIEAASLPSGLKQYGLSTPEALSMYGVLTGMALPCILFPSAVTGSVGTVLLPALSSAQTSGSRTSVILLLKKAAASCLILGLSCCLFFLTAGNFIGSFLFHSTLAGKFILTLAWICPFLYTNTCLLSALTGLGKTTLNFLVNSAGLLVRICGVFFAVPFFGIAGYLRTLLLSQLTVFILSTAALLFTLKKGMLLPEKD